MKVLGPTTDFPSWGSGKGTEYPKRTWLWRFVRSFEGFDYRTSIGLWKQRLLEGTNKTLCLPGPRRKEQWPHKRLSQTCLCVLESLWQRRGWTVTYQALTAAVLGGPTCWYKSFWMRLLLLSLPLTWGQTTGREHSPTHQQKIKGLLSMALPTRARPSFPHSQCFPSGSLPKPLIFIHQRADRMKTTVTAN